MTQEHVANLHEISEVEFLLDRFKIIYDLRQFKLYFYNMNAIAAASGNFEFVTDIIFLQVESHLKHNIAIPKDLMFFYAVTVNDLSKSIVKTND